MTRNFKFLRQRVHPLIIRVTHWINFLALGILITSGLRIYNASPIFGSVELPTLFEYGGLAYARQWHFFAMWIFFVNGFVWVAFNMISHHGRQTTLFSRTDASGIFPMVRYYLRLEKMHPPSGKYNSLQKLAYTATIILGAITIISGIALYWPVQFSWLAAVFGGYDTARVFHFVFMATFLLFLFGHIVMVIIAGWDNFLSMFTGKARVRSELEAAQTNARQS